MKRLLYTVLLLTCFTCLRAQEDTAKYAKDKTLYGQQSSRVWPTKVLRTPYGSLNSLNPQPGAIQAGPDGKPYWWDGTSWVPVTYGDITAFVKFSDSLIRYATPTQVLSLIAANIPNLQAATDVDNTTTNDIILRNAYYKLRWPGWAVDDYKQFSIGRNNDTTELMNQYLGNYSMAVKIGTTTFSGQQHLDASSRFTFWQPVIPFITNSAFSVLTGDFYRDLGYAQDSSISGTQAIRNVIAHNQQYLKTGAAGVKGTVLQATLINDLPRTTPWKIFNVNEDGTDLFTVHGGGITSIKNTPSFNSPRFLTKDGDSIKLSSISLSSYDSLGNTVYITSIPLSETVTLSPGDRNVLKRFDMGAGTIIKIVLPPASSVHAGTIIMGGDDSTAFDGNWGIKFQTSAGNYFNYTSSTETPVFATSGFKQYFMSDGISRWSYQSDLLRYTGNTSSLDMQSHSITAYDITATNSFYTPGLIGIGDDNDIIAIRHNYIETGGFTADGSFHFQWSGHSNLLYMYPTYTEVPGLKITPFATGYSQYAMFDGSGNIIPSGVFATAQSVASLAVLDTLHTISTTVIVEHSYTGGLFVKRSKGTDTAYAGMRRPVAGDTTKFWYRMNPLGASSVDTKYFFDETTGKEYDPATETQYTGYNAGPALNLAAGYFLHRNGNVLISMPLMSTDSVFYGEGTTFTGTNTLFPSQTNPSLIRYNSQSAVFFYGTNGFVPVDWVVDYRNQKPQFKFIGIFGDGKQNGKKGIVARQNLNSTTALHTVGIGSVEGCYIDSFHTGIDLSGAGDSWTITNSQPSRCIYAIRSGNSGTHSLHNDYYADSVGFENNNYNDIVDNCTFEYGYNSNPNDTISVGVLMKTRFARVSNNFGNFIGKGIHMVAGATRSEVYGNMWQTNDTTYAIDSGVADVEVHDEIFFSSTQNPQANKLFIYARKAADLKIYNIKASCSSCSLTTAGVFDTCTGMIFTTPKTKGLQSPDNKNFVFNGCTFSSQVEFQNKIIQGNLSLVDGNAVNLLSSGKLTFAQDSSLIPAILVNSAGLTGTPAYDESITKFEGRLGAKSGLSSGSVLGRQHYKLYTSSGASTGDRAVLGFATNEATTTSAQGTKFYIGVTGSPSTSMSKGFNVQGTSSKTLFKIGDTLSTAQAALDVTGDIMFSTASNGNGADSLLTMNIGSQVKRIGLVAGTGISFTNASGSKTIAASAVPNSALATMANNRVKGNVSGSTAVPGDLTATELTALVNPFTTSLSGAAPASGGGTTNFLRADGTWTVPVISGSFSGTGTATTTFTVTIGATLANTTYKVLITSTSLLGAGQFYVTNKTTTTFNIVYATGLTGTLTFDWGLIR